MDMWAHGFVYLDDVFCRVRKYTENHLLSLAAVFRESFMNTLIDDSGVRFKIVYLASKKQWRFPVKGQPDFRSDVKSEAEISASGIRTAGMLQIGFYIRVEAGMSSNTYRQIVPELYRTRYTPEHPKWMDECIHGTDKRFVKSIIDSGLICGGVQRQGTDKRAEVHLVNALVTNGAKTAGVKRGSNAYVKLNTRRMYDDGIVMFISEESEVIFTKGERDEGQDRIDPKYFLEVRSSQGKTMWPLQNRWDRRANAAPRVPSLMPPAKIKVTSTSEKDEENTEEESRKAPFSVFSAETTVAVPYKRPPEMPPPIVTPVKAEAIPTVYKSAEGVVA